MTKANPPLNRLAQQARTHDSLLASLLYTYQGMEGLSDSALAAYLQCDQTSLPRLALCRRPRPAPQFRQDVEQIARFAGVNPLQLMRLIRAAESHQALHQTTASSMLLAARDHEPSDTPDEPDARNPKSRDDG